MINLIKENNNIVMELKILYAKPKGEMRSEYIRTRQLLLNDINQELLSLIA